MLNLDNFSPSARLKIKKAAELIGVELEQLLLIIRDREMAFVIMGEGAYYQRELPGPEDYPFMTTVEFPYINSTVSMPVHLDGEIIDDLFNACEFPIVCKYLKRDFGEVIHRYYNDMDDDLSPRVVINIDDIYIKMSDCVELKKNLLGCCEKKEIDNLTLPFLDKNHEYYSEELALAVNAWLALYGEAGEYKSCRSHKNQIENMIKGNGLSAAAIERISTLVNPQKKGGAPSSGS